jgi:Spy/CpxP family protein refolding chaperone
MRHRIFGILLCALILAGPAFAQAPGRMVRHRAAGAIRVLQQLDLTPEQRTQVRSLFQQQRQQVQAVRQDQSLTPEQRQAKIKAIRQGTQEQMLASLTPDQRQRLTEIRERAHPLQALNLTPEQQSKLKPILQEQRQQVRAVRRDQDLTPRQKRAKVQEIRQSTAAQLKSILTPEQQQRFEQLRQRGRPAVAPAPDPSGF